MRSSIPKIKQIYKYIELSIECIDDKIYVKREIKSLVELVSLKWLVTDLKIKFPTL